MLGREGAEGTYGEEPVLFLFSLLEGDTLVLIRRNRTYGFQLLQ